MLKLRRGLDLGQVLHVENYIAFYRQQRGKTYETSPTCCRGVRYLRLGQKLFNVTVLRAPADGGFWLGFLAFLLGGLAVRSGDNACQLGLRRCTQVV